MQKEIEAKFLGVDKDALRAKLKEAGYSLVNPEYMMRRKPFDVPHSGEGSKWARVREEAGKVTMSVKHDLGQGIHDVREAEVTVNGFDEGVRFLEALGLEPKSFQENLRETWTRGDTEVCIDTWPGLRPFAEVEAPDEETVRAASAELGFDFSQAIFGGVARAYEKELGIPEKEVNRMPEITFANPPQARR